MSREGHVHPQIEGKENTVHVQDTAVVSIDREEHEYALMLFLSV